MDIIVRGIIIIYLLLCTCNAQDEEPIQEQEITESTLTYEDKLMNLEIEGAGRGGDVNPLSQGVVCKGNPVETSHVQMLFAFDITSSTNPGQYIGRDFVHKIDAIAGDVRKTSPDAEFALTYNANWPRSAFYHYDVTPEHPYGHTNEEGCYIRKTKFSKDTKQMKAIAQKTHVGMNASAMAKAEAALPAIAFAAADNVVGWERDSVDGKGDPVQRFIVMYTDDDSLFFIDQPGERTDFRLDGTDSCATTWPPTYAIYNKIFTQYEIKVIGIFTHPSLENVYAKHFNEIKTPFCSIFYEGADSFRRIKHCMEYLNHCSR